jgi:hypothetical protein
VLLIYALSISANSIKDYVLTPEDNRGKRDTYYSNYVIFTNSFDHLIAEKDLYRPHRRRQNDLFKYSPSFAFFMAPFALLPDLYGLWLWNLLNAGILLWAIYQLPLLRKKQRLFIAALIFSDVLTVTANAQTNSAVAGLILISLTALSKSSRIAYVSSTVANFFVKLFGGITGIFFVLLPKPSKTVVYAIATTLVVFLLPLTVASFDYVFTMYQRWLELLIWDQDASLGRSIFGVVDAWFGIQLPKMILVLSSFALFIPLVIGLKRKSNTAQLMLVVCSLMLWMIVFNHKSESNTFIIAITALWIWFFMKPRGVGALVLMISAVLLISLSPTDIFPSYIRKEYVYPLSLKAVPAILGWGVLMIESYLNLLRPSRLKTYTD